VSSGRATVAEEEYLESLFWLFEAGLPMTAANLARAMQLKAPTVHEMLGRLERDGYIVRDEGRAIDFTPSGRAHAEHIVSRHRMIERFLTDVVGVPWDDVHEEAEQLEHAMTPRFEAYVRASVGDAKTEAEDLLHYLKDAGIEPGMEGEIASNDGELVTINGEGRTATVTASVAETVSVLAEPSPPARIALPEQLVLARDRYGR